MTYLPDLRRSLVSAAERAADQPHTASRAAGGQPARRPRRWPAVGLRSIPVALGVVLAVGIAVLALTQIRHQSPPRRSAPATTQTRERRPLLDILGVLRRPQTSADLDSKLVTNYLRGGGSPFQGPPDRGLIRRATTTPWGSPVFLVPVGPGSEARMRAVFGRRRLTKALIDNVTRPEERLTEVDSSGSGGGATASAVEAGQAIGWAGAGRSFAGGSTQTRLILIVPDGVAKVAFVIPRQVDRNDPSAPVYRHSLTATAIVHNNVAAIQIHRECCGGSTPMIWYAADGQVLKRVGNPAAANRVIAAPKQGPQTPQSRAAERDPSTPNHVWVTPATGGPRANFAVRFRVLLTEADYSYTVSGPHCPGLTFSGGSGGGPDDVRGHVFTGTLGNVVPSTGWCPGTYRVHVTVMDLGRARPVTHPARAFGSATFTVRR
ncbi:MAG TPA: hypothetical protein VHV28_07185 [Solirubrobacteraceae bacterium]|jgi:hypothetical protein|nr:hypothetical protein [Solirubrobacteraceae bacterium]